MPETLEQLLDKLDILIFELDADGRLLVLGGGLCHKLGLQKEAAIGAIFHRIKKLPVHKIHLESAAREKAPVSAVVSINKATYETTVSPLFNDAMQITAYHCICLDMSKRLAVEQELDEERFRDSVTQRIHSLTSMAQAISREAAAPIATIKEHVQLISRFVQEKVSSEDQMVHPLAQITLSCERMEKITGSLESFARSTPDDPILQENLYEIINNTYELCRSRFESKNVQLDLNITSHNLDLECRVADISHAIFHLLSNALEAAVASRQPWVKLKISDHGEQIEMKISDSGLRKRPPATKAEGDPFLNPTGISIGHSLGLGIAKGIINNHLGSLTMDKMATHNTYTMKLPKRFNYRRSG